MRHCCKNCQFLTKVTRNLGNGEKLSFSWTTADLLHFKMPEKWGAECAQGIWSTGIDPSLKSRLKEVLLEDRRDRCFFIEVHKGMSNDGARALHKLRNDNVQLRKSYRYTQIALGIAAASLFANLIYNVIKDFVLD